MRLIIDKKYMRIKAKLIDDQNIEDKNWDKIKVEDVQSLNHFIPTEDEIIIPDIDIINFKSNNIFEGDKVELLNNGKCKILKDIDIYDEYHYTLGNEVVFKDKKIITNEKHLVFDEKLSSKEKVELEEVTKLKIIDENKNEEFKKKILNGEIPPYNTHGERIDFLSNYNTMIEDINERCIKPYKDFDIIPLSEIKDSIKNKEYNLVYDKYWNVVIDDTS
jgi:hypothetical protein